MKPNLFKFSPKELTQDGFFAWLISWAIPTNKDLDSSLNQLGTNFLRMLLDKPVDYQINKVAVKRQWEKIDIKVILNDEYFIAIEDKTGTGAQVGQLERYKKISEKYCENKGLQPVFIYLKTLNECRVSLKKITEKGYKIIDREIILGLLETYLNEVPIEKKNDILTDYYEHLKHIDKKTNNYKELPLDKWDYHSWSGFYSELQNNIMGNWQYVPNKSGGFVGFFWYGKDCSLNNENFKIYLQLEQDKLVFKLTATNPNARQKLRNYFRKKLALKAKELNVPISKYGRLGKWMGVAKLNADYRVIDNDGKINIDKTVKHLQSIEYLLDETHSSMQNEADQ